MIDNSVFKLTQPGTFSDPLTEVLRSGARALLTQAVEAEVAAFLDSHAEERTEDGRRRLVRHGHLPEREIMTGIGRVAVRTPRVRDRVGTGEARIRFTSAMLPPYARRSKSLEVLIPILYLKGVSTGDFSAALGTLLGPDAGGLSASTIARLKDAWAEEHARWCKRDLSAKRYVYVWADGIHVQARLETDAQCLLVIIGATPEGKKELVGLVDGVRESAQSCAWTVEQTPEGPQFVLLWQEKDGPPVSSPLQTGFGSKVIERGLAYELKGRAHLDYQKDGVVCKMVIPMAAPNSAE